ncbi:INO80 complex subunit B-like [Tubulanus polymorphus]|uniref:INO80 complex subunit B-like n=1 Tax=Tubulanus polymorphus TaxID=672921 RepID=UPI003DA3DD9C
MGKKRGVVESEDVDTTAVCPAPSLDLEPETPPHKKHKKHKKKHKKSKHGETADQSSEYISVDDDSPKPAIKLKIKIGKETLGTTSVTKTALASAEVLPISASKGVKDENDDTSDEEKQWLDALEKGDLDDNGELKKSKDKKLLTTRQKALLHGKKEKELLQLPIETKSVELTKEQLARRQQTASRRRQQAHEKQEKDKKLTLERLLKKQESKNKAMRSKGSKKMNIPRVRYLSNKSGIRVSIPHGFQYPLVSAEPLPPPKAKEMCGVEGCNNPKKYNCSKTSVRLCSLACYRKNLEQNSGETKT